MRLGMHAAALDAQSSAYVAPKPKRRPSTMRMTAKASGWLGLEKSLKRSSA
jgi:hypothetical protein